MNAKRAPFPPVEERFERLEETLQISKQMWSENNGSYNGRNFQLAETLCSPQPLSKPHPPILIGGSGEKKTLRLVAQYADACNLFASRGIDVVRNKLDILKRHCEKIGRDYAEIEKTTLSAIHLAQDRMSAEAVIEECRALAGIGIQHAIFNMPNVHEITPRFVWIVVHKQTIWLVGALARTTPDGLSSFCASLGFRANHV